MKEYLKHITHCSFRCNRFEEMRSFYRDIMGLEEVFTLPYTQEVIAAYEAQGESIAKNHHPGDIWLTYFRIRGQEFVELFNLGYDATLGQDACSFRHLAFLVEDITKSAHEINRHGIPFRGNGRRYLKEDPAELQIELDDIALCGSLSFEIEDPEGNVVEFQQYTPKSLQICD